MKFILVAVMGLLPGYFLFAQESADASADAAKKPPTCKVVGHGWSEKGELVLGASIAAGGRPLVLGKLSGSGKVSANGKRDEQLEEFTMAASSLVDLYTGQVIEALPSLPRKPFLGTLSGIITLPPGDSLVFGVAFPHPPDPPKTKDGKPQDYQFELRAPKVAPVKFSIPFQPAG